MRIATAPIEALRTNGTIDKQSIPVPASFDPPPYRAHAAEFRVGSQLLERVELAELESIPGPMRDVEPKCWPPETTSDLFFPVFSERFADRERFYGFAEQLDTFIRQVPPFDRPEVGDRLQLRAYFWPTPTIDRGWFETPDRPFDCDSTETSLFYGNREIAKSRIGNLMYRQKYGLVLVDSPYRGGAGGQDEYGYPAWATVTSCPGEDWCAIALHEIGHAFGLGDEYVLDSLAYQAKNEEPNVGVNLNRPPADWPVTPGWAGQVITEAQQAAINPLAPGTETITGYFQGARYRRDYCRPSLNCLMRSTTKIPSSGRYAFCKVCEAALAEAIS